MIERISNLCATGRESERIASQQMAIISQQRTQNSNFKQWICLSNQCLCYCQLDKPILKVNEVICVRCDARNVALMTLWWINETADSNDEWHWLHRDEWNVNEPFWGRIINRTQTNSVIVVFIATNSKAKQSHGDALFNKSWATNRNANHMFHPFGRIQLLAINNTTTTVHIAVPLAENVEQF